MRGWAELERHENRAVSKTGAMDVEKEGQSRGVGSFLRGSTALQSVSFSLAPQVDDMTMALRLSKTLLDCQRPGLDRNDLLVLTTNVLPTFWPLDGKTSML